MKSFLKMRTNDLTIGQNIILSLIIAVVSYVPFAAWSFGSWIKEKIDDRRYYGRVK